MPSRQICTCGYAPISGYWHDWGARLVVRYISTRTYSLGTAPKHIGQARPKKVGNAMTAPSQTMSGVFPSTHGPWCSYTYTGTDTCILLHTALLEKPSLIRSGLTTALQSFPLSKLSILSQSPWPRPTPF